MDEIKEPRLKAFVERLQQENIDLGTKALASQSSQRSAQLSMFENNQRDIVSQQLDLNSELERIEHILRGHLLKRLQDGNEIWVEPTKKVLVKFTDDKTGEQKVQEVEVVDTDRKPLNEYGVQLIMGFVISYINKNTLLSNYDETTINSKMNKLGNELNDLLYMKYDEIVLNLGNI